MKPEYVQTIRNPLKPDGAYRNLMKPRGALQCLSAGRSHDELFSPLAHHKNGSENRCEKVREKPRDEILKGKIIKIFKKNISQSGHSPSEIKHRTACFQMRVDIHFLTRFESISHAGFVWNFHVIFTAICTPNFMPSFTTIFTTVSTTIFTTIFTHDPFSRRFSQRFSRPFSRRFSRPFSRQRPSQRLGAGLSVPSVMSKLSMLHNRWSRGGAEEKQRRSRGGAEEEQKEQRRSRGAGEEPRSRGALWSPMKPYGAL